MGIPEYSSATTLARARSISSPGLLAQRLTHHGISNAFWASMTRGGEPLDAVVLDLSL